LEIRRADATSRRVIKTVIQHRELIGNLVARELKVRYRGSALGFLWTVLVPLFMAAIYVVFLQLLGGRSVPVSAIIIGVFAWQFTTQCVQSGLTSITGSVNLVKKVALPRLVLPVASTLAALVSYLLTLVVQFPALFIIMAMNHQPVSGQIWIFPAIIAFQLVFNLGLALLVASVNVYFRDLQHIVGVLLSAWFFVSPVMYDLSFVQHFADKYPTATALFMLNPMSVIITAYRAVSIAGVSMPLTWPTWAAIAISIATYFIGLGVFRRLQKDFADLL
jgi:ABC-type polysaccharide/polyol phosphate export permease